MHTRTLPMVIVLALLAVITSHRTALAVQSVGAAYLGTIGSFGSAPGKLSGPGGVALSDDGFLYVADTYNSRVQKFQKDGQYISGFGSRGSGPGQFSRPYGIDVDASGNVYVGDLDRHDVQVFSAAGALIATMGQGALTMPFGLWVSDDGVLFVADPFAHQIKRFATNGAPLAPLGPGLSGGISLTQPQNIEGDGLGKWYISDTDGTFRIRATDSTGTLLASYGTDFDNPRGCAVTNGQLFVAQGAVDQIDLASGYKVASIVEGGGSMVNTPLDCAAAGDSLLFVADTGNNRILRYRLVAGTPPQVNVLSPNGGESLQAGTTANIQWLATDDVAVKSIDLMVSQNGGSSFQPIVQGLPNTGSFLWTVTGTSSSNCIVRVTAYDDVGLFAADVSNSAWSILPAASIPGLEFVQTFGSFGSDPGQLNNPRGIATSDDGFVYIADTFNSRIEQFASDGTFVGTVGAPGSGTGGLRSPYGIDVDPAGNLFVSDSTNRRVLKFNRAGQFVSTVWNQFEIPYGLYASDDGVLYVTDALAARVYRFSTAGTLLDWWASTSNEPHDIVGSWQGRFYVSDHSPFLIRVLDPAPTLSSSLGTGFLGRPRGAAVLGPMLLVTEADRNRVTAVDRLSGLPLATLGESPSSLLSAPFDVATLGDSLVFILDSGHSRVLVYRNTLAAPPHVTVDSPNGGEILLSGDHAALTWHAEAQAGVSSVELALSRDGGATYSTFAAGLGNTGAYDWVVPAIASQRCRVRVRALDSLGLGGQDLSNADFTIGDRAVPTVTAQLQARGTGAGVELQWDSSVELPTDACSLQRADTKVGPYSALDTRINSNGLRSVAVDGTALPGRIYWYRLRLTQSPDGQVFGPVPGAMDAIAQLRLAPIHPVPSRGELRLEYALPRDAYVRLCIIDVQGREVARPVDCAMEAGPHAVTWLHSGSGVVLGSGVYFVALEARGIGIVRRQFVIAQ